MFIIAFCIGLAALLGALVYATRGTTAGPVNTKAYRQAVAADRTKYIS